MPLAVGVEVGAGVGSPKVGVGWSWKSNSGKTRETRNNECWVFMAFFFFSLFFPYVGVGHYELFCHLGV